MKISYGITSFSLKRRWLKVLLCMKLLVMLVLVNVLQVSAKALTQNVEVSMSLQEVSLIEFFAEVKNQTGFDFLFNHDLVANKAKISVGVEKENLEETLKEVLHPMDLDYTFEDEVIIISKRTSSIQGIKGEQGKKEIKGKVSDIAGVSLPGVSVVIKGSTTGTSTNMDGEFTLTVPTSSDVVLVVSFIGMETKEVPVGNKTNLNIELEASSQEIEEVNVVVYTGYQKIDRSLFTGSATKVTAEEAKVDGVIDVGRMLEGKAAGVSVQSVSGTFGAAPKIRVRGTSSIYGDQKPLWVVDGVVLEDVVDVTPDQLSSGDAVTLISSAVAGLNANDIEDFQILKDASATALYGARAMNGVIVITTKKGHTGKTRISYSGEYSMRLKPSYSNYNIMNSQEHMSVLLELERKGLLNHASISRDQNGAIFKKMYDAINDYNPETGFGLKNTPEDRARFLQQYEMANTDWFGVLFKNSITQNHSLSLSTGTEKSQHYFSMSIYDDAGWSKADAVSRYTANVRSNFDLSDKISVGFAITGAVREQEAPGTFNRINDAVNLSVSRDFDINPFSFALNTSRTMRPYDNNGKLEYYRKNWAPFNILNEYKNNLLEINMLDLKFQGDLKYKINKNLEYNFVGSMRYVKTTQEHKIKENSNIAQAYRSAGESTVREDNRFLFKDLNNPDALKEVVLPKGGFYNREDNKLVNFYLRNTLNWNKTYNETHMLNALAGQELKYADRQNTYFNGYGYQYNRGGIPFTDYRILQQQLQSNFNYFGMSETYDRFLAFFLNGSYSYLGKYTFNGTVRVDGSNQLGKAKSARWLPTWNLSGAWNVHREAFLADSDVISMLSLRATYGLTASMGAANNSTVVLKNRVSYRPYEEEKEGQMYIESLENSDLTWEKQYETNIGIDLGLFHNRISISSDVYSRKGFDLIGLLRTPGMGGQQWKYANYADMNSRGVEFSLNTKNFVGTNFKWTTNLTFAYNENEITNLKSKPLIHSLVASEGGTLEGFPVRGLYSIKFDGLNEEGLPTFINENGQKTITDVYFQSEKTKYLKYEGPIDPKIIGGISNLFQYKNWRLNTFISYQLGNKIRLYPVFKDKYTDWEALPKEFNNRWTLPGDENITDIPVIASDRQLSEYANLKRAYNAYNYSSARVADGSFVRMKEISLTYDFPKSTLSKLNIGSMSLKLQATNLFLIYSDSKLNGQDPEFFGAGGVALPVPKQFTFTLKLGL